MGSGVFPFSLSVFPACDRAKKIPNCEKKRYEVSQWERREGRRGC